ncbi:MFS general substrate transporter [Lojkania enalia]|uniref:MFS general substrate transporter n=1 Tax=Lojkania enalia TaxID=147567 RepID=A0A9P4N8M6_9PLEO|nr:MFS general substrate transporter [Didymosphaeria enalia]
MANDEAESEGIGASDEQEVVSNLSTGRLHIIIAGLWLCLFMSAMDTTIITTALMKISSGFTALDQATWLITTYLITYNSFLMICAKFSDVLGVKAILLFCNIWFLIFSMACGGAQTMVQLIVFRAFQGIGGSGLYSLVFVTLMKIITPEKLGFYSGIISSVFALANLLGPILGGVIADHTTWRWIFWINGPIVAAAAVLLFFSMPGLADGKSIKERLKGFDIIGGFLSVCWPIPLLFGLQEGGIHYEWNSEVIIGTLVAGIVALIVFGFYEAWITYRTKKEAIFPIRFITNPHMALLLSTMFLIGMPFYVAIIQLPQRFQAVNNKSAEKAGILLLPLSLLTPVGAMITGVVIGKRLAGEYCLIIGAAFICVGIGLLSGLPVHVGFSAATYGYEVVTGFGLGFATPPLYYLLATSVGERDISVGTGALNMVRTLGGAVAVAICSALHHSKLRKELPDFLNPEQIMAVEDSTVAVKTLPPEIQLRIGEVFGRSYNLQFQVMLAFSCFLFLITILSAVVRKRAGIFGAKPIRKEENEFMKKKFAPENSETNHEETTVGEHNGIQATKARTENGLGFDEEKRMDTDRTSGDVIQS